MAQNDKFWCAFSKLTKNTSAFVNVLYSYFGSIEKAWNADCSELKEIEKLTERQIKDFLSERDKISPDECIKSINDRGITFLHPECENYPYLLRYINNPPTGLFMLGNLKECNLNKTLAVVGSRRASDYAKTALKKILQGFANTDICIVSGLAEGIDTIAHKTAVENGMKTIAVIGGGFDKLYPKSNKALFEKIINGSGVVMSEYWYDTDAISWHFPARNRIVSGLAKGVLIAEAALKSGAMITANVALEQGKELMCIPGLITNPNTGGIYKLLKSGAAIVTKPEDILFELSWEIKRIKVNLRDKNENCTEQEAVILELLRKDALSPDELIIKTGLDINELLVILMQLELNEQIRQVGGEKYISV